MNKEVYKEMCSQIYEGESWDRMINCLERKDKEIERLNNIINKAIELLTDENYLDKLDCYTYPKEVIEILKGEDKE